MSDFVSVTNAGLLSFFQLQPATTDVPRPEVCLLEPHHRIESDPPPLDKEGLGSSAESWDLADHACLDYEDEGDEDEDRA